MDHSNLLRSPTLLQGSITGSKSLSLGERLIVTVANVEGNLRGSAPLVLLLPPSNSALHHPMGTMKL